MSEDLVKYYSIHNLLNIKVNTSKKFFGNNVLNNPLAVFEVTEEIDADIEINIGKFEPNNEFNYLVDHKYHINKNYLYFEDRGESAQWKVEINGLDNVPIHINFDGKIFGINKYLVPDVLYFETVLKPLIELELGLKGYFLAHGGALTKNDCSILFFGLAGSLKSTLILNGVKKGYKTLGDDKIIINKKNVNSFPVYHQIFDYTVSLGQEELSNIQKFKFLFSPYSKEYSNAWEDSSDNFNQAFILKRTNNDCEIRSKVISNELAISNLIKNNMNEMYVSTFPSIISKNSFPNILNSYSYIYPESKISNYWKNLENHLKDVFKDTKFYEVEIPQNFNNITNELFTLIGGN